MDRPVGGNLGGQQRPAARLGSAGFESRGFNGRSAFAARAGGVSRVGGFRAAGGFGGGMRMRGFRR